MRDIERELQALGERARAVVDGSNDLSPSMKQRIKARRFSAVTVASLVAISVVGAGTFAARWSVGSSSVPPAGGGGPFTVDVPAEVWVMTGEDFLADPSLNLAWGRDSEQAETLACVVGLPPETSSVELTHEETGDVLSWDENFVANDDFATVCRHNIEAELLVGVANDPSAHRLVIDGELEVQLVRSGPNTTSAPTAEIDETKLLEYQATEAIDRGNLEAAEELGRRRVDGAMDGPNWAYGNALHYGHLILGHVALRRDDLAEAKRELIRAGQSPGSPQLDSFGPNMSLARDLLILGEDAIVLEYMDLVDAFWDLDHDLEEWEAQIRAGEPPDFGSNVGTGHLEPEPIRP